MARWQDACIQLKMVVITAALGIAATVAPAWGSLGGDAASVQADQVHMQGRRTMRTAESFTAHEIQGSAGTLVREYVSPERKLFGLAWQGSWLPDMRQT